MSVIDIQFSKNNREHKARKEKLRNRRGGKGRYGYRLSQNIANTVN